MKIKDLLNDEIANKREDVQAIGEAILLGYDIDASRFRDIGIVFSKGDLRVRRNSYNAWEVAELYRGKEIRKNIYHCVDLTKVLKGALQEEVLL